MAIKGFERDKNLEVFIKELRRHFKGRLKEVILFGSRARGDFAPDSDYDCILILDRVDKQDKEFVNALEGEMLYQYNTVFSAFLFTLEELGVREYDPFMMNVRKEGVPL